jgi:hypothetical protein
MITKRDKEIVDFINIFGKTYYKVLGETFFNNEQVARNRINLLIKEKIFRTIKLDQEEINAPKTCIVLGSEGKFIVEDMGKSVKDFRTTRRINHNLYEQIAYYYLVQTGTVERTTIANHFKDYKHIPDFILKTNNLTLFVEIELSLKSPKRYIQLIEKTLFSGIDRILYIVPNEQIALKIYDYLPISLREFINFSYITFEDLKINVLADGKIKPKSYPKTKEYIKPIQTIEKTNKIIPEPNMNDLELEKDIKEIQPIEIIKPKEDLKNLFTTGEKSKKENFNIFSFLLAKFSWLIYLIFFILIVFISQNIRF